MINSML